jgi:cadmium resistance protein CadD (predicted permease)
VGIGLIGQAIGLFALTNIDGFVIIVLFFGQAIGRDSVARVIVGTYLGFTVILAISILGAVGVRSLPEAALPYFGLLPLTLGLFIAWSAWREHRSHPANKTAPAQDSPGAARGPDTGHAGTGPGVFVVAAVTLPTAETTSAPISPSSALLASGKSSPTRWCSSCCSRSGAPADTSSPDGT